MNPKRTRVLIADSNYLIAMDLERILQDVVECDIAFCHPHLLAEQVLEDSYDIVMVDAALSEAANLAHARAATASGARVIFLTTIDDFRTAFPSLQKYSLLQKPYDQGEVAEALAEAARDGVLD